MQLTIKVRFEKGYIADPYWPEREELINIQKASGVNRLRGEDRRAKALSDYLAAKHMTMDDYRRLEELAESPFYTQEATEEIIVPRHQVHGCFAQGGSQCSSSLRIARAEQIRTILESSDWLTGKSQQDGVWRRFVVVKSGSGKSLTNQRALRANPFIAGFDATGILTFAGDAAQLPRLRDFLVWAGREVGVGASRGMGWGRFTVLELEAV